MLSRDNLKQLISDAIFDMLDDLDADMSMDRTTSEEADMIADAVFQVITETNDEDITAPLTSIEDVTRWSEDHD